MACGYSTHWVFAKFRRLLPKSAERQPSYATAFPRANVGSPAAARPAASTISGSSWHPTARPTGRSSWPLIGVLPADLEGCVRRIAVEIQLQTIEPQVRFG